VWGPAPTFVGKNNFYVSFIDDYSKFTWIYLLRHKSEVFQRFHDFQKLVERMFDKKILLRKLIGEGNIKNLIPLSNVLASLIMYRAHMRTNRMAQLSVNTAILLKLASPF